MARVQARRSAREQCWRGIFQTGRRADCRSALFLQHSRRFRSILLLIASGRLEGLRAQDWCTSERPSADFLRRGPVERLPRVVGGQP